MLINRRMLIMWALLGLQAPLITISQDSGPVSARKTNDGGLTIHRNSNCDGPGLEWAKSASLATGETLTICFTPKSSAYIYIVNESAEGTYMAYPQSADQLGPIATRQTYAFDIVGEPGPETFTFFITQNPIAHFDDAIRRSRLQLSRSRLLHGDGSEAAGSHTNILGTIHAKPLRELAQSNTGSAWLIDLEDLDVVVRCLLDVPGSPRNLLSIRERVRLNSDLSNITQVRSQSDDNDVSPSPRGTAMILEFSYDHRSQR